MGAVCLRTPHGTQELELELEAFVLEPLWNRKEPGVEAARPRAPREHEQEAEVEVEAASGEEAAIAILGLGTGDSPARNRPAAVRLLLSLFLMLQTVSQVRRFNSWLL
ncbi:hypothetical protein CRENBAI_007803 [Crenichthys baileyi]|uniref:Uncharacterized protein n=1 Tax=Crenichthys baileyi TaxID=28760 RepID=A0AAV9RG66_9TELE